MYILFLLGAEAKRSHLTLCDLSLKTFLNLCGIVFQEVI